MFGVLAVDKPADWTSRDVVNRIQGLVRPNKAGHTGTLDPMATGVLLIAIGPATRLVEFSHAAAKSYRADFQLGMSSDTLDSQGNAVELENASAISEAEWLAEMHNWKGAIEQTPPKFSAVHVAGRRAYELARAGQEFELPSRTVFVQELKLRSFQYPRLTLDVTCGSGTYIRSLGSDIAQALGSDAIMTRLVRTSVGDVHLADCVDMQRLEDEEDVAKQLISPACLVSSLPSCTLGDAACKKIRNGIPLMQSEIDQEDLERIRPIPHVWRESSDGQDDPIAAFDHHQNLVAVLAKRGTRYRSLRVFHSTNATAQPRSMSTPHKPES